MNHVQFEWPKRMGGDSGKSTGLSTFAASPLEKTISNVTKIKSIFFFISNYPPFPNYVSSSSNVCEITPVVTTLLPKLSELFKNLSRSKNCFLSKVL